MKPHEKGTERISENKMTSVIDFRYGCTFITDSPLIFDIVILPKNRSRAEHFKKSGGGIAALLINHGQSS